MNHFVLRHALPLVFLHVRTIFPGQIKHVQVLYFSLCILNICCCRIIVVTPVLAFCIRILYPKLAFVVSTTSVDCWSMDDTITVLFVVRIRMMDATNSEIILASFLVISKCLVSSIKISIRYYMRYNYNYWQCNFTDYICQPKSSWLWKSDNSH